MCIRDRPSLPLQYGHYAAWTHARAATPAFRKSTDYWRERLAGAPALSTLPADPQAAGSDATAGCQMCIRDRRSPYWVRVSAR